MKAHTCQKTDTRTHHFLAAGGAILLLAAATPALAGNRTFTGVFAGDEPTMPSTISSCAPDGTQSLGYVNAGTFQVDTSGGYLVIDTGNIGYQGFGGIRDASVLIYRGNFNPASPATNRIAAVDTSVNIVDEQPTVNLESGLDYVMVIQHWCDEVVGPGPWGAVIEGPGSFSGAGFPSAAGTFGNFANVNDQAVFDVGSSGPRSFKYTVARTLTPTMSGQYAFVDVSGDLGFGRTASLIYEGPFNAADPNAGFLHEVGINGLVTLEEGQQYTLVLIDAFAENARFQVVTHGPGQVGFDTQLNGAWFDPATSGQGVLLDYGPNTSGGFLFLAWFTFDTPAEMATQAVGASDQRWLTGSGPAAPRDTETDLMFANTTGGAFNQATPAPSTDAEYGVGQLMVEGCGAIRIDYELPGNLTGFLDLERALPGEIDACYEQMGVGPLIR